MKKIIILILCISYLSNTFCQENFNDYKKAYEKLDITKVSGNVLHLINEEMKSIDPDQYDAFVQSKRKAIYQKFDLGNKNKQQLFLNNYNQNLSRVKDLVLTNDVLMHTDPTIIADYGSDVLTRYQGNYSSEYISALIQPVIKSKLVEYTNYIIDSVSKNVLSDQQRLNVISEQILAYWKATGENVNLFKKDIQIIQNKILVIVNKIPVSDSSLQNFLIHSSEGLANGIKEKFSQGWNGTITILNSEKNKYETQFTQLYQNYASSVKQKTEEGFKNLGSAIDSLSRNEVKVYQTLDKIQNDWNTAKQKIDLLEGQIQNAQNNPALLAGYVADHAKLLAENFIRLDVINKYVNKGVEVYNTVSLIKSEVFDKITDPEFINSLSLDNLSLPTLSDACASAAGFASQVAHTFPNCKPLQAVATAANYLMAAVNIGVGVAELYSMNPMGLVNIFSGLSSVFGGKPEPSSEMKMMQQMMDYMSKNFDHINERLDSIEMKIDKLTKITVEMYQDMMKSFAILGDRIDRIDRKIAVLDNRTRTLLLAQWNHCTAFQEGFSIQNTFRDYQILSEQPDCKPCLDALSTYTIRENSNFNTESSTKDFSLSDLEVSGIFKPTAYLFQLYNSDRISPALNALNVVSNDLGNSGTIYYKIINDDKIKTRLSPDSAFNGYFDYKMLFNQTNFFSNYSIFYEISNADDKPLPLISFLNEDVRFKNQREKFLEGRYLNLLELVNYSIIQQSMIAGNSMIDYTYNYLLGACQCNTPVDNAIINTAISVLDSNKLFAKNFASTLVYGSINRSIPNDNIRGKRFTDLYFSSDVERINSLNMEFKIPMVTYDLDNANNLILKVHGRGREFTIPVPSPTFIIKNAMAQSDGLYTLFATKQKIIDKLIDLTYFKNFQPVHGLTKDDYKYLIQDLKK